MVQKWIIKGSNSSACLSVDDPMEAVKGDVITLEFSAANKPKQEWLMRVGEVVGERVYLEVIDRIRIIFPQV